MRAHDPGEKHRVSTSLELLFDLCFVVAVSQASAGLRAALAGGTSTAAPGRLCAVAAGGL
ncbi:low temperature requirement protein A [Streptomyces sp. KR55]|uniref:low temperature requirement protein A n=1 Tax=Streptomyces sp. KR55 TaxID=3457425 RepID=UPI003FD29F2D